MRLTVLLVLSAIVLALFGLPNTTTQAQAICPGALPSRLVVGEVARITPGDANNVRDQPSRQGNLVGQVPGEGVFTVLEGPVCADGLAWWRINYLYAVEGWTVEGSATEYFTEPITPGATPTPQPTATSTFTPSPTSPPTATFTATLVPTITLTPTITPIPTNIATINNPFHNPTLRVVNKLQAGARVRVSRRDDPLAMRSEPSWNAEIIDRLEHGTLITLLDEFVEANGFRWWPVGLDSGRIGWVTEGFNSATFFPTIAPLCPEEHVAAARLLFYYTDPALGAPNLYTSTLDGESVCNVTYQAVGGSFEPLLTGFAAFSPDGSQIAIATGSVRPNGPNVVYGSGDSVGVEIWQADGSGYTTLLEDMYVTELAWSPDGERIAVSALLPNQLSPQIWGVRANGDGLRVLTSQNAIHRSPQWSPDGERVMYTRLRENGSDTTHAVGMIGFDLSRPQAIETLGTVMAGAWSPDSAQAAIYYQDDRIDIIDAASGEVERSIPTETETFGPAHLYWPTEDGALWLLAARTGAVKAIYALDAATGEASLSDLTCEELFSTRPTITQDDDGFIYMASRDCLLMLEEIMLDTPGQPLPFLPEDATRFAVR